MSITKADPVSTVAAPSAPLLTARGLSKSFPLPGGNRVEVLHAIDLEIASGEFVAIMGASGSGKSTLLYALSGIDSPTSGTVSVGGVELSALGPRELEEFRLTRIGFVFQQPHLLDGCSVRENVQLPALWRNGNEGAAALDTIEQRLQRLGISHVADNDAASLSGGQRQRAGIARALVNSPDVCFADEPTGALDSGSAEAVLDILGELHAEGLTIVMVTHDPNVAARAQRVIRVVDGRVADG